jgi:hypothetical protein
MCECCGQHDHDAPYLPEAEKLVNTKLLTARDRSLDLKTDGRDAGRTEPYSLLRRDVNEAAVQPPLMKTHERLISNRHEDII